MMQRQITHPSGTFAACADCRHEPRHYTGTGSRPHEAVRFAVIGERHRLDCRCQRTTGWCDSLDSAVQAWGRLGETLPLPLVVAERSNVRPMRRAVKARARA